MTCCILLASPRALCPTFRCALFAVCTHAAPRHDAHELLLAQALQLALDVSSAMVYLHKSVVHR